jgi:hypothetical protein
MITACARSIFISPVINATEGLDGTFYPVRDSNYSESNQITPQSTHQHH